MAGTARCRRGMGRGYTRAAKRVPHGNHSEIKCTIHLGDGLDDRPGVGCEALMARILQRGMLDVLCSVERGVITGTGEPTGDWPQDQGKNIHVAGGLRCNADALDAVRFVRDGAALHLARMLGARVTQQEINQRVGLAV